MPVPIGLALGKVDFVNTLKGMAGNTNSSKTSDQTIQELADAIETFIKTATVTVPGTGLVSPSGAVTGESVTGGLE